MAAAAFESRRADSIRVGDVIHYRSGVHEVLAVRLAPRLVTVTVALPGLGEAPLMFLPAELIHTERFPRLIKYTMTY